MSVSHAKKLWGNLSHIWKYLLSLLKQLLQKAWLLEKEGGPEQYAFLFWTQELLGLVIVVV